MNFSAMYRLHWYRKARGRQIYTHSCRALPWRS